MTRTLFMVRPGAISRLLCLTAAVLAIAVGDVAAVGQPGPDVTSAPKERPAPTEGTVQESETAEDQPSEAAEIPSAVVVEVRGDVDWAPPGVSPLVEEGWTEVEVSDDLVAGTVIRTGVRSHVNLKFGETTFVSIRSSTYASIDQFYRTATTQTVRIGLGYGTVRGGSTEGEVRSDVVVDSPAATLAKRGTEGWQIYVEPGTGRFDISLARLGLVEAVAKLHGDRRASRTVRPGEYATLDNIANMWIDQEIFDRNVTFYVVEGLTVADAAFSADNPRGCGVLAPGAGSATTDFTARVDAGWTMSQIEADFPRIAQNQMPSLPGDSSTTVLLPISRPEGNFGTPGGYGANRKFRVLVPRRR